MNPANAPRRRPRFAALGAMVIASAFIAGPTPGDIGGCGGDEANIPLAGEAPQPEYDYFDQGFCSHLCFRLRECGVLCDALLRNGQPCDNDSERAYLQCVRGELRTAIFTPQSQREPSLNCPHSCQRYQATFGGASLQDVVVCGHAVDQTSCSALVDLIQHPPSSCTAVCR